MIQSAELVQVVTDSPDPLIVWLHPDILITAWSFIFILPLTCCVNFSEQFAFSNSLRSVISKFRRLIQEISNVLFTSVNLWLYNCKFLRET